ncbi:MAG TPA: hypothetical protein VMV84_04090 [Dehalococcoidales bacterium]|nr:hypothetical protein [Dehalococcoidales bacterium]
MIQKYRKGQKVRIVEVKNQHGHLKYPKIEEYVNETGVIVEPRASLVKNLDNTDMPESYPIYTVRLDKSDVEIEVCEDALAAVDE